MVYEAAEWSGQRHARRRFLRLPVSLPVVARVPQIGVTMLRGMVRTVSAGGLTTEFPISLMPDSILTLVLETRKGPVEVEGRVVWACATPRTIRHEIAFYEPKPQTFATELFLSQSRWEERAR